MLTFSTHTRRNEMIAHAIIHCCAWGYVLASPLLFRGPHSDFTIYHYLRSCIIPLTTIVVFYLNYAWLVERLFLDGRRTRFVIVNICIVLLAAVIQEALLHYVFPAQMDMLPAHLEPPSLRIIIFKFGTRTLTTNIFSVMVSLATRLSLHWLSEETERQQAELRDLKSQMNPHFLLNTLNNIYSLTAFDPQKAQQAIQQLSKLLRYMLYADSTKPMRLVDEVDFIQQYIALMRLRLPDTVDVQFSTQLPPNCQHLIMPHLTISLVENAFKHGISSTQPSFVHISIVHHDDGTVVFRVDNSNYPKPKTDLTPGGIGLQQVARRLELSYHRYYRWNYGPSADGKTYSSEFTLLPNH